MLDLVDRRSARNLRQIKTLAISLMAEKGRTFKALAWHRASWYRSAVPGNEGQM
jgi:hypothetical protein